MNIILYKSIYKTQLRTIYIHSKIKLFKYYQHIHNNKSNFCTETTTPTKKQKIKIRPKLKSKAPITNESNINQKDYQPKASRIAMLAESARMLEEQSRWFSPRNTVIIILSYLAISFSLFGYMWYHRLYASRLMYVIPFLLNINPERSHKIALKVHNWPKLFRRMFGMVNNPSKDPSTKQKIWGLTFLNPIGMAAGFDKHGEAIDGILDMGFGFIEIGTVTPNEQKGNDTSKPRLWRLKKDLAIINNYGNNSVGFDCVKARLLLRIENMDTSVGLVGVNLGKNDVNNHDNNDIDDYILGIQKFVDVADYLVINLDLPDTNTRRDDFIQFLSKLIKARDEYHDKAWENMLTSDVSTTKPPAPPFLIKISLDYDNEELEDIAFGCMEAGVDGIIVSNSSVGRKDKFDLKSKAKLLAHSGGLSGKPIFNESNKVLKRMYGLTRGQIPLIGVGGISSARDAYTKIKCGASLVQVYTAYTYNGPFLIRRMIREVGQYAELDGYDKLEQAVGCDVRRQWGIAAVDRGLSIEEEELMADLEPIHQKSRAARAYGVLNAQFQK